MHAIGLKDAIKLLMKTNNINKVTELARQVDVPQQTLHRILSGATTNPQVATLQSIAHYFQVTVSQLLGEEPLLIGEQAQKLSMVKLPTLAWEDAPYWKRLTENYTPKNWQYWAVTKKTLSKHAYALTVENSTWPMPFTLGATLIIDPDNTPEDGQYVICHRIKDGTASLRRIEMDGNDQYLIPLKKEIGNATILTDEVELCGTVVKVDVPLIKE